MSHKDVSAQFVKEWQFYPVFIPKGFKLGRYSKKMNRNYYTILKRKTIATFPFYLTNFNFDKAAKSTLNLIRILNLFFNTFRRSSKWTCVLFFTLNWTYIYLRSKSKCKIIKHACFLINLMVLERNLPSNLTILYINVF